MFRSLCLFLSTALWVWPSAAVAMSGGEARHLLVRTGFAATAAEIADFEKLRYEHGVDRLLRKTRSVALTPPPSWAVEPAADLSRDNAAFSFQSGELKAWWFSELRTTDSPLTERMTLFWHGYFASALGKVHSPQLMYRQNLLLRHHALGDFRSLLQAIVADPAMLRYAGTAQKGKGKREEPPRQLIERFTTGPGQFAVNKVNSKSRPTIEAMLNHPRTAERVVAGLWREFVSDTPDAREVKQLAEGFRKNYRIKPLLRALLLTKTFRAPQQRGRMIKSPVELLIGTVRQFGLMTSDDHELAQVSRMLGQDLFDPPDADGWRGGSAWISGAKLIARQSALGWMLRGAETEEGALELAPRLFQLNAGQLTALLLPVPPADPVPTGLSSYELARHLVRDPAYQLK